MTTALERDARTMRDLGYHFRTHLASNSLYRVAAFAAAERATNCRCGFGQDITRIYEDGCEVVMDDGYAVRVYDEDLR